MNTSTLVGGVVFGSLGLGFFVYGKKQKAVMPLICGLGLMLLPYLISNIYLMILSGFVMTAAPFLIKI
jgi:hypothetical protein